VALDVVATLAIIAAAGAMIWSSRSGATSTPTARPEIPLPTEPVSIEGSPAMGSPDAKVVIVAFSDFECPYCGRFAREVLPELKKQYIDTGQVQFVFKHLPLTNIHPQAMPAAVAAECAAQQGNFWEFHDRLFGDIAQLSDPQVVSHAVAAGLDMTRFGDCRAATSDRVQVDLELARTLGVAGTPTVLVAELQKGQVVVRKIIRGGQSEPIKLAVAELLKST
jgi:protein-disulfide isomerase